MIILSKVWGDEADPDALLKIYTCDVVLLYSLSANLWTHDLVVIVHVQTGHKWGQCSVIVFGYQFKELIANLLLPNLKTENFVLIVESNVEFLHACDF
jgi:hypothetical protein